MLRRADQNDPFPVCGGRARNNALDLILQGEGVSYVGVEPGIKPDPAASPKPWIALGLASSLLAATASSALAADTFLEFDVVWGAAPISVDRGEAVAPDGTAFSLSRLDLLVSDIALLKEDGSWLESRDWQAFLSAGRNKLRARMEGMPTNTFRKIRFSVGLSPELNGSDPNTYPSGHPLHPQENGLHWGWQGGYIFMALEGRARDNSGKSSGFSYHLGNIENRVWIEVPADLDGARHRTLGLRFDVAKLFDPEVALSPWRDGTSTHSRAGDPVVSRIKAGLAGAFSLGSVSSDTYQELPQGAMASREPPRTSTGTPLVPRISARLPKVTLPPDNPLTDEGVALGKRLFNEPRLSRNNALSCAGCHQQERAFADRERPYSIGVDGTAGKRNAMPLFNLAWHREFFWDGRVTGLRHQTLAPIQDAHEMAETLDRVVAKLAEDQEYPSLFGKVFGGKRVTADRIGLALEQYLLTLITQNSKFDRAARGEVELTAEERDGLRLFVTEYDPARGLRGADCFHCHGGNLFTSGSYANNGLDTNFTDPGRFAVTRNEADRGKFKVPSLRNVAVTAPYMHDGRFATLEQVIEHYANGVRPSATLDPNLAKHPQLGLELSASDKKALAAFLRTLTDDSFLQSPIPTRQALTSR